jgi:tetratricopeptide (TPR) repeat protein
MTKEDLLELYEARGEEGDFLSAKPLYEAALAETPNARLLSDFGYLLYCHAQRELRRAVELYERAIALEPEYDKPHYQLIVARAGLREPKLAVEMYEERLRGAPGDVRLYRFLASAYEHASDHGQALSVAEAGLALAADDAALLAIRGEAKAGLGDIEGALADWQRAVELEPDDIGALYSSAFLLERHERVAEAIDVWRKILEWNESRGHTLQTAWPKRELERLSI